MWTVEGSALERHCRTATVSWQLLGDVSGPCLQGLTAGETAACARKKPKTFSS